MKISVLMWSLYFVKQTTGDCISPNVRTVLWRSADLHRRCWSDRDIAELYARRLFQMILPVKVVPNIPKLMAHFKTSLQVVREIATTKETYALLMRPMVDTIGGYLQAYGLPITIEEYYEGNVTYNTAKRVDDLLKAIKKTLSTDGGRWTRPIYVQTSDQICPYNVIPANPFENHCSDLVSSAELCHSCKSEKELGWLKAKVPLPFLDNTQSPKAIAVPFRTKTLYGLFEKKSRNILTRYYTAATHCYTIQGPADSQLTAEQKEFDLSFYKWLIKEVVPLLHDGIWYPAFGNVHRILATLASRGLEPPWHKDEGRYGVRGQCLAKTPETRNPWFYLACVLWFLVMFWVVVWVAQRLRRNKSILKRVRFADLDVNNCFCDEFEKWYHSQGGGASWSKLENEKRNSHDSESSNDESEEPNIINYSEECDTPHSAEMLEAIVESLVDESSFSPKASSSFGILKTSKGPRSTESHLAEKNVKESSLLSTTVFSQDDSHRKPLSRGYYSLANAVIVTRTAIDSKNRKPSSMSVS